MPSLRLQIAALIFVVLLQHQTAGAQMRSSSEALIAHQIDADSLSQSTAYNTTTVYPYELAAGAVGFSLGFILTDGSSYLKKEEQFTPSWIFAAPIATALGIFVPSRILNTSPGSGWLSLLGSVLGSSAGFAFQPREFMDKHRGVSVLIIASASIGIAWLLHEQSKE